MVDKVWGLISHRAGTQKPETQVAGTPHCVEILDPLPCDENPASSQVQRNNYRIQSGAKTLAPFFFKQTPFRDSTRPRLRAACPAHLGPWEQCGGILRALGGCWRIPMAGWGWAERVLPHGQLPLNCLGWQGAHEQAPHWT